MGNFKTWAAAAALTVMAAGSAQAVSIHVNGSGVLTAAYGVDVGGTFYDVVFSDGTCVGLFDGCDDNSDFAFQTAGEVDVASQALLDQVFVNMGAGMEFDDLPSLTAGCEASGSFCASLIPYAVSAGSVTYRGATNYGSGLGTDTIVLSGAVSNVFDTAVAGGHTYAVFNAAPVPLPAPILLLIGGVAGLGALRARKG